MLHQIQAVPLQVRWRSTRRAVAAGPTDLLGEGQEITEMFLSLPHGQLVIIGDAGAGKSVLAMQLTAGMLDARESGQTVPALLSIASWNPVRESLAEFVVRRLADEFPRELDVRRLLDEGEVVPILDGFDEMPEEWHATALERLDEALRPLAATIRRLVVTCRSEAYVRAVETGGTILPRAAVVELEPVGQDQVRAFLSHAVAKPERWLPVFERMEEEPSGPLATALSTPLMATLARAAYRPPTAKPRELLSLTDTNEVTGALIDGYVDSLYGTRSREASRWLSCLALYLSWTGTREFVWWRLAPGMFAKNQEARAESVRWGAVAVGAVVATLLGWLCAEPGRAWPARLASELGEAPTVGLVVVVVLGFGTAGVFRSLWPDGYPPYVSLRYRGRGRRVLTQLGFGATFGLAAGLASGPALGDIVLGLVAGCVHGLVNSAVPAWSPRGRAGPITPRTTLTVNHRYAIAAAAQHGLVAAAIFAAAAAITPWSWQVFSAAAVAAVVFGSAAALTAGWWTWMRFRLAHAGLALVGWLPRRLFAFLDNAQERGVLRPAGTAWQFRHALVQDHLAVIAYLKVRDDLDEPAAQDRAPEDDLIERSRARTTGRVAAWRLADRLARGQLDDSLEELRAHAGDDGFSWPLAFRRAAAGDVQGAISVLHGVLTDLNLGPWRPPRTPVHRPHAGPRTPAARLKELRDLRARARAGEWDAGRQLADLLAERGEVDELTDRAKAGDPHAAERLADLCAEQGDLDGAAAVLRPRADAGDGGSALQLAELLAKHGRGEEAIDILRAGFTATRAYYWLLAEHGHLAELRELAEADSWGLAADLPALLERFGHLDELRAQADAGNWRAAERRARVLAEQGEFDELGTRAAAGDWYAGVWLTVRDIPHPWPKVGPVHHGDPPPVPQSGQPDPPAPVTEAGQPVGVLKLMWYLGPYHSTNPRRFSFLACVSAGVVIGAALEDLRAAGAVVAGVLAAAVLAWLVPLLRQETAAWAMLTWRAAPKRVRSAALTVPIVVVPALCAASLALSPPLDAVVLAVVFSAYFVVVLAALKAVPLQDRRYQVSRPASA